LATSGYSDLNGCRLLCSPLAEQPYTGGAPRPIPIACCCRFSSARLGCPDTFIATPRMVVKHKGAVQPTVTACTLLPYDPLRDFGPNLAGASDALSSGALSLRRPAFHQFCVLGGAACSWG